MSEVTIAGPVVAMLVEMGWDVFQEVSLGYSQRRADIVGAYENRIWVVEVKKSLSLSVMDQAWRWKRLATWVSIAVPFRHQRTNRFCDHVLRNFIGVGLIEVESDSARILIPAPINRWAKTDRILERLHPLQKSLVPAGSIAGGFYTPFRATCRDLAEIVKASPGISMKEAVAKLSEHHYTKDTTAVSCLLKWARLEKIPDVRMIQNGRKFLLFPEPNEARGETHAAPKP